MTDKLGKARRALAEATAEKRQITRLPGRAALARRWPGLRVNRLNYQWIDDTTGERGYGLASLLTYLETNRRGRQ